MKTSSHTEMLSRLIKLPMLALLAALLGFGQSAQATDIYYTNQVNGTGWGTATVWDPNQVPTFQDVAFFTNGFGSGIYANNSAGAIVFSNTTTFGFSSFVLTLSNAFTGGAGLFIDANAGPVDLNGTKLTLLAHQAWVNNSAYVYTNATVLTNGGFTLTNDGAGGFRLTGVISGTGGYVKKGSSTNTLTAANLYTGSTIVNAGTLNLTGNRVAAAGAITVANGGVLGIGGGTFTLGANSFTLGTGSGVSTVNHTTGAISFVGAGNQLLVGNGSGDGTYNLSGGSLTTTNVTGRGVILGVNDGRTGTFNLSGGTLTIPANSLLQIGRSEAAATATNAAGIFNQTGGTANIGELRLGGAAENNDTIAAQLKLSGGTFVATNFTFLSAGTNSSSTITISGTANVTLPAFPNVRPAGSTATNIFDGGTLRNRAASTTYMQGLTAAYIKAGGARINTTNGSITIAQDLLTDPVSTGGGLTKDGANTLTLTGANTYTGPTTVNAGTLAVGGSLLGAVTNNVGATINPATVGGTGILTLTNVLNDKGTLAFDLTSPDDYDRIDGGGTLAMVVSGTALVRLNPTTGTLTNGTYYLITNSASLTGGLFVLANGLTNQTIGASTLTLINSQSSLILTVSADVAYTNLTWRGASIICDTNNLNWTNIAAGVVSSYADGANVIFDDTAATGTVAGTNLSPASIVFNNNTLAYSLTTTNLTNNGGIMVAGNGSVSFNNLITVLITGSGGVTKNGTGLMTLGGGGATQPALSFTGPVTINGGGILIGSAGLGTGNGNVTLNGGSLAQYFGNTFTRGLGAGVGQIQIPGGNSGFSGQGSSGSSFTITNTGLAGNELQWGSTYFNPSIFTLQYQANANGFGSLANPIDLNGTTRTFDLVGGNSTGGFTLSGAVRSSSGTAGIIKTGPGTLILGGNNTFTGDITISAGTLSVGNNSAGTLGGGIYASNISIASGATLRFWTTANQTNTGVISGAGGLQKAYGGTLTLSTNNTYSGKSQFVPQTVAGFTVNVASFNSVNGGTPLLASSSLGCPTNTANGTIDIGSGGAQAAVTLNYTGSGETTDRILNIVWNGNISQTISASGSGLLKFTATPTLTPSAGTGSLILTGSGTGEFVLGVTNTQKSGLSKQGNGTWTLSGTNTYTWPTTVSAGTLLVNGALTVDTNVVTVSANATFGGKGTISGPVNYLTNSRALFVVGPTGSGYNNSNYMTFTNFVFMTNVTVKVDMPAGLGNGVYVLATNYQTPTVSGTLTFATNSGSLGSGGAGSVSVDGNNIILSVSGVGGGGSPTITGQTNFVTPFVTTNGIPSAAQNFAVTGANLTADITATAATGFEVTTNISTAYGSTATLPQTGGSASGTIYIRLAASAPVGTYNSSNIVVLTSAGATSLTNTSSASGNVVSAAVPGNFSGISVTGTTLNLTVTNGVPNGAWTLLESTNLLTPIAQWPTNRTGNYDGSGNLTTNIVNTATNPAAFYLLK